MGEAVVQGSTTTSQTTIASFTGTLLRRKHELGEKFVQLVFREDDHDVLCISTNPQTAALPIGQAYRVEGTFTYRGKQALLLDPKIAALKKHWRPIRRVVFAFILLASVAGIGGVAYMQHGTSTPGQAAPAAQPPAPKVATTPVVTSPSTPPAAPAATPTAAKPVAAVSTRKTVVKTAAATPATTPATSTAPINVAASITTTVTTQPTGTDDSASGQPSGDGTTPVQPPATDPTVQDPGTGS